jgi:predicted AAA+ superfamily ATPase
MYRKALSYLNDNWFKDTNRKPLILRGARQVGKTWLAREFAKQKELTLVELNFERNPELKSLFQSNDPRVVLRDIESYTGISIKLESSLLFLDEIQDAPEVLSKLRWFYEEIPELPVIAAGSLLEFVLSDHSFSMPVGRISYLYVEPLSFEEFLLALDEYQLLNYIKTIELPFNIPDAIHQKLWGLFNLYCFVGGMPACVVKWIETKTLLDIAPRQEDLIATYRDDFYKYKGRLDVSRLLFVLSSIPNQLGQKFMYSRTGSDMQANVAKQILTLFNRAKLTHTVKLSSANTVPLSSEIKDKAFKQIFLDVGLVNRMLSKPFQPTRSHTAQDGGISEQVVGQMLRTLFPLFKGPELYYWQREEKGASAEIDYLIEHNGDIIPIEVKSGSTGSLKSLHYFMYHKQKKLAVRINDDLPSITEVDVKLPTQESVSYTLLSIPFYLTFQVNHLILLYRIKPIKDLISKNRVREAFDVLLGVITYAEESITTSLIAIFDKLTPIVETISIHKDFLVEGCSLLWELSKQYDASSQSLSTNYNHPIRILKEIFSYKPEKTQDYLIIAVDWAIDLLETYNAEEYPFSPFDFLGEIMKPDGKLFEYYGNSITSTGFTINIYEFVAPLRSKVIEAVLKTLASSDTKKACDAAKFVSSCLTYDENEDNSWTKEAFDTVEKIKTLVIDRKISDCALIELCLELEPLLTREVSNISNLLRYIQTQIHK